MAKISKKKQNELIQQEINKLVEIFRELPDSKMKVAMNIIERVAFMKVTLEILEDDIKTRGPTYLFQNGSQRMKIENPSQKSYNTMITRYTAATEKLINLVPKDIFLPNEVVEEVDDFEEF